MPEGRRRFLVTAFVFLFRWSQVDLQGLARGRGSEHQALGPVQASLAPQGVPSRNQDASEGNGQEAQGPSPSWLAACL